MKLVGELKEKVEKTETQEEAKEIIKDAGMELTDDELERVAGGKRELSDYEIARENVKKYCAELISKPSAERKDEINKLLRTTYCEGVSYYQIGRNMGLLTR